MITLGQLLGGRPDLRVPDVLLYINGNRLHFVHPDKDLGSWMTIARRRQAVSIQLSTSVLHAAGNKDKPVSWPLTNLVTETNLLSQLRV